MTLPFLETKIETFMADDFFSASFLITIILLTEQHPQDLSNEILAFFLS